MSKASQFIQESLKLNKKFKSISESTNEYLVSGTIGDEKWSYRVTGKDKTEAQDAALNQLSQHYTTKFRNKHESKIVSIEKTNEGEFEESTKELTIDVEVADMDEFKECLKKHPNIKVGGSTSNKSPSAQVKITGTKEDLKTFVTDPKGYGEGMSKEEMLDNYPELK